jgi:hypothetical protein
MGTGLNNELIDLTNETEENLELVSGHPLPLGSTHDKPDEEYCKKMFAVMEM